MSNSSDQPADRPAPAPLVEGYEHLTRLASGGTATVYSARRCVDGAAVAVKIFDADHGSAFARQCAAARRLDGVPGVLAVEESGTLDDGRSFLVTPFAPGGTLAEHINRFGPMPAERVAALGALLGRALGSAHAAGVLHRDLKPSNLLLDGQQSPLIADFGAASTLDTSSKSATATMAITVMYAAPEVLEGAKADERSDIYSLALSLVSAAAGRPPFAGSDASALAQLVNTICTAGVPDPRALGLPDGLAAVLRTATRIDPDHRYATATQLAEALDAVAADPATVPPGTERTAGDRPGRRGMTLVVAGIMASAAIVGALAFVSASVSGRGDGAERHDAGSNATNADASTTALVLEDFGAPVTPANGIMGALYQQNEMTYVGVIDPPCPSGGRLAELSTHAGPKHTTDGVATPWEAVSGDGVGVFISWMPCDTGIAEARFVLGATGRWFVYIAEFPEDQYRTMVAKMRVNETSPSPDYTVDEDVLATLANPDVYKGWAVIDRPA